MLQIIEEAQDKMKIESMTTLSRFFFKIMNAEGINHLKKNFLYKCKSPDVTAVIIMVIGKSLTFTLRCSFFSFELLSLCFCQLSEYWLFMHEPGGCIC